MAFQMVECTQYFLLNECYIPHLLNLNKNSKMTNTASLFIFHHILEVKMLIGSLFEWTLNCDKVASKLFSFFVSFFLFVLFWWHTGFSI